MTSNMNLVKLTEMFHSDERCRAYLESLRWPDGILCPRCESKKISRSNKRKQFVCDSCDYNFSVTAGTIFHGSHLSLVKWFMAVYLMGESRKGISANQMKRTLSVSYKTAWYLCHRIRAAMKGANPVPLIEADETWVGGKKRGMGRGYTGNKTSEKHLQSYLDEGAWRFNNRGNPYLFRDTLIQLLNAATLEYKELINDYPAS